VRQELEKRLDQMAMGLMGTVMALCR